MATPFQEWIDRQADPRWTLLPLTHITRGVFAEKALSSNSLSAQHCDNFNRPCLYMFYGRPAYRASKDKTVNLEISAPFCFIMSNDLLSLADEIYPFDTGAFFARLFNHILDEGLVVEDFALGCSVDRVARLVEGAFEDASAYYNADRSKVIKPEIGAQAYEMQARAFLTLLASAGRNEPDDRICTIEAQFSTPIQLDNRLMAVIAPHTVWDGATRMPLLESLDNRGVQIASYNFIPGRHPEYYQAQIEAACRSLYEAWGIL